MLKLKWQPSEGMLNRDDFAAALTAERIPFGKGYGRMMHENPLFTQRIAYKDGFPFTADINKDSQHLYGTGAMPISEAVNQQFLWFKFINPPNTLEDMDDVVAAFDRILR